MTVLEQFEFRIITEKKSSDNLPISLQLLLSASEFNHSLLSPNSNR